MQQELMEPPVFTAEIVLFRDALEQKPPSEAFQDQVRWVVDSLSRGLPMRCQHLIWNASQVVGWSASPNRCPELVVVVNKVSKWASKRCHT